MHRMPSSRRLGWLFSLAGLDRGLLIGANDPHSCGEKGFRSPIESQNRPRSRQERLGIQNVLPRMIAPRSNPLLSQPASYRARRNASHDAQGDQPPRNLSRTPAHQRLALLSRSTAGQARGLRPHLRGKNAGELRAEANPRCSVSLPSAFATCALSNRCSQLLGQSAGCSNPGDQRPATGFEPEVLCLEGSCEHLPVGAGTALLRLLIRSDAWAWVHAFSTSRPSIVLKNQSTSNPVRIYESVY